MSKYVLDSSAILAVLKSEKGADVVMAVLPDVCVSSVNVAEVIAKLCERGMPSADAQATVEALGIEVIDLNLTDAVASGDLRVSTRALGLSLGDRVCLAVAQRLGIPAMTTDTAWQNVQGIQVRLIR